MIDKAQDWNAHPLHPSSSEVVIYSFGSVVVFCFIIMACTEQQIDMRMERTCLPFYICVMTYSLFPDSA